MRLADEPSLQGGQNSLPRRIPRLSVRILCAAKTLSAGYRICRVLLAFYYIFAGLKVYEITVAYTSQHLFGALFGAIFAALLGLAALGKLTCPLHPNAGEMILWSMKLPSAWLYAATINVLHLWIAAGIFLAFDIGATLLSYSLFAKAENRHTGGKATKPPSPKTKPPSPKKRDGRNRKKKP